MPVVVALGLLGLTGCAAHQEPVRTSDALNFKRIFLPFTSVTKATRDSLLWIEGMELRVEDMARGLFVTEWQNNSPDNRFRITLRIQQEFSSSGESSMISAHAEEQVLINNSWQEVPSSGQWEKDIMNAIESRLVSRSPGTGPDAGRHLSIGTGAGPDIEARPIHTNPTKRAHD